MKLGFSKSEHTLVWRYQSVDTHCPTEIDVMGVWRQGTKQDERALHGDWSHSHFKGEWFHLTAGLKAFIEQRFEPFTITKEMKALAMFLRSQKEAEIPLLVNDERFVSLEATSVAYEAGQETWLIASEQAEANTRGIRKKSHRPEEVLEIVRLRAQGHSFRVIAEKVGKSEDAVRKAHLRSGRLNAQ